MGFKLKTIVLLPTAYGAYRNRLLETIRLEVSEMVAELNAEIVSLNTDSKSHIVVSIRGEDEEFIANALAKEYGSSLQSEDLVPNRTYSGQLVDVGRVGYGIYSDIGVTDSKRLDALVPLHRLRDQFTLHGPLKKIVEAFVLVEHLPVEVNLTSIDLYNNRVEGEFNKSTLTRITEWMNDDHERLLIFGANYKQIEISLKKTKHREDIYEIEQLGKFEFSLKCKRSTRASGILAAIGPKLRGVPMHLFIPKELEAMKDAKT
ncbi:MAG: DUF2110 family protein [Candidatus Thorarchaeota archaeon]|nr:DUF2110 family protein [Candidatus Thorarchaeota archaeon]